MRAPRGTPVIERILRRVAEAPSGCWIWPGYRNAEGYGQISWDEDGRKRSSVVHRRTYEHFVAPIPAGFQVDHLCHDPTSCDGGRSCPHRACCNPAHLEAVEPRVNNERSGSVTAMAAQRTACPAGHPYDDTNTFRSPTGSRECRECRRIKNRRAHHANRENRLAYFRERRARQKQLAPAG